MAGDTGRAVFSIALFGCIQGVLLNLVHRGQEDEFFGTCIAQRLAGTSRPTCCRQRRSSDTGHARGQGLVNGDEAVPRPLTALPAVTEFGANPEGVG